MRKKDVQMNPVLDGGGGEGGAWGWAVESNPINICEYFKNGLQYGPEIF